MGLILVMAVLGLSAWVVFATGRHLQQTKAARGWWIAFALLLTIGCGVGVWFAFSFEYQVSLEMRVASFPIPLGFFHLEEDIWVDYVTPPRFAVRQARASETRAGRQASRVLSRRDGCRPVRSLWEEDDIGTETKLTPAESALLHEVLKQRVVRKRTGELGVLRGLDRFVSTQVRLNKADRDILSQACRRLGLSLGISETTK